METFNIKVNYGQEELVLTILAENGYFLVIYYGGIFGAVRKVGSNWTQVPDNEIAAGHLPRYEPGLPGERIEMEWNSELVQHIGTAISDYLEQEHKTADS